MTASGHFRSAFYLLCLALLLPWAQGHSVNNRKLQRVEGLSSIQLDIAPRPESFFTKRSLTRNAAYAPTQPKAIEHDDILRLKVFAHNQTFYLHLHPNNDIFHPNAVFTIDDKQERIRQHEHRVYKGYVIDETYSAGWWTEDQAGVYRDDFSTYDEPGVLGWARIVIRNDIKHDLEYPVFEGAFSTLDDIYHVKATQSYHMTKRSDDAQLQEHHLNSHMVIYRSSDTVLTPLNRREETHMPQCGYDAMIHGNHEPLLRESRYHGGIAQPDSFNSVEHVGLLRKRAPPTGCPTTKQIAYIGAAADCTYARHYQSPENARTQIINDFNTASAVYDKTFNVQLGLINITIKDETCPSSPASNERWNQECSTAYTITNRLGDFSQWRASHSGDGASLWHLMTSCASGVEVGVAWVDALCVTTGSQTGQGYVSGAGVSSITRDEWTVVAHEIGHNFGASHDCTADTCQGNTPNNCCPLSSTTCDAQGQYIMNPSSNQSTDSFSTCTTNLICSKYADLGRCLEDPGSRTVATLQMCGNGIKEDGEDCDPGGQNSTCCNAQTCKFINNAKCDDASDLCCQNCQPRPAEYVCRPAVSNCDVEEKCPGDSGNCPKDTHKTDGESCGDHLQCASGQCTSRDQQCRQRGADMNISRACGSASGSCQMICDSSGFSCMVFNGFFIDGTPCGVGGACKDGKCSLDNFGDNAKNWIENNKQIAIPVIIVVGLLVLFCIFRCLCYGCCGVGGYRTLNNKSGVYVVGSAPAAYPPPNQPYYHPPPQGQWVDPSQYNGQYNSHYTPPPSAPPPAYAPSPVGGQREAYEMNPRSDNASPPPANQDSDISGRVQRFQERMSPR